MAGTVLVSALAVVESAMVHFGCECAALAFASQCISDGAFEALLSTRLAPRDFSKLDAPLALSGTTSAIQPCPYWC